MVSQLVKQAAQADGQSKRARVPDLPSTAIAPALFPVGTFRAFLFER